MSDDLKNGISMVLLSYEEEENLRVLLPQIKEKLEAAGYVLGETGFVRLDK